MKHTVTISTILSRWPNRRAVLEDVQAANPTLGMVAVHRWFQRGSVPAQYDAALLQGARKRGFSLSPAELVSARAPYSDLIGHSDCDNQGQAKRIGRKIRAA